MERCLVIGAAGSGKTTFGRRLASKLGQPFIDLDDLYWNPGWTETPPEAFVEKVATAAAGEQWVVAGNYTGQVRDVLWPRADSVVWLDLPRSITFRRVVRRTWRDTVAHRELWPGCRQTLLVPLRTHLFSVAWAQPAKYRVRYAAYLAEPVSAHLEVVRLRTQQAVDAWLAGQPKR